MNIYLSHKEILEQILHYTKKTQSGLARELGVPQPNINAVLTGKSPEMSKKIMAAILKQYREIDGYWLLTGEGEMLREKKVEKKYENSAAPASEVREPESKAYQAAKIEVEQWRVKYVALQAEMIELHRDYAALQKKVEAMLEARVKGKE